MSVDWHAWALSAAVLAAALVAAWAAHRIVFAIVRPLARRKDGIAPSLVRHLQRPARLAFPLLTVLAALPATALTARATTGIRHVIALGIIATVAWTMLVMMDVLHDALALRYKIDVSDNLRARKIQTQMQVLRRTAAVVISIVAFSVMLMTFPSIRQFGVSLFASAGVAGLVVGMAARPTLSSLLAGLQIALTEPIRIEDVVIVEGEWGWIEEITTTYVVVRIWDLRRLIVPLSYFIEHPFQNWTRVTADILGTVYLYTDYTVPVDAVREEVHRLVKSSDLWNGKAWGLVVTDAREHTVELRALMSASDSGKAWDLRCAVREGLITFMQQHHPESLPRTRVEMDRLGGESDRKAPPPPTPSTAQAG